VPEQLWRFGAELKRCLNAALQEVGLDAVCQGLDIHPQLQFAAADPALKSQLVTLYIQEMAKRGCHGYASFYLNAAQGPAELDQTTEAARAAFTILRDGLARGAIADLLECDVQQDAFRRLVR
jgi:glutamate-1-semialdehyde 2,1-aminomutase